jgi:hypothetical protein
MACAGCYVRSESHSATAPRVASSKPRARSDPQFPHEKIEAYSSSLKRVVETERSCVKSQGTQEGLSPS